MPLFGLHLSRSLTARLRHESANSRRYKLVRDLTLPDPADGKVSIDRGAAVVFELRHFPRYYKFTERMLLSLKERLAANADRPALFLIEEIDITLKYIQQNNSKRLRN